MTKLKRLLAALLFATLVSGFAALPNDDPSLPRQARIETASAPVSCDRWGAAWEHYEKTTRWYASNTADVWKQREASRQNPNLPPHEKVGTTRAVIATPFFFMADVFNILKGVVLAPIGLPIRYGLDERGDHCKQAQP